MTSPRPSRPPSRARKPRSGFSSNYRKLVSLGKAVPKDADTSSLLVQLETLSKRAHVDFRAITLDEAAAGAAAATTPPPAPVPPAEGESSTEAGTTPAATTATTPAGTTTPGTVPTEATAALLPIGATVGTAGLPVMPYSLEFQGGFFDIADFFGSLDRMVESEKSRLRIEGRLLTIDGFTLEAGPNGFPDLTADVSASSYLTPADQGIVAGATPGGPAVPTDPAAPATTDGSAAAPATAVVTP